MRIKTTPPLTAALLLAAVLLTALTACQSDDNADPSSTDTQRPSSDTPRPLTVVVSGVTTRGTVITTDGLNSFSMNYQNNQYDAAKDQNTGVWSAAPASWPSNVGNDTAIDFYAYNGGTFQYNSGSPYINFAAANETPATTTDLLVAHTSVSYNKGYGDTKGAVALTFDHACAAVDFSISSARAQTITIREITLNGVKKTGSYHYATGTWDNLGNEGTTDTYTLFSGSTFTLEQNTTNGLDHLGTVFLIPQTLATVTVRYTVNESNKKTSVTLNKAVTAGNRYPIDIRLQEQAPVTP